MTDLPLFPDVPPVDPQREPWQTETPVRFDGPAYEARFDAARLTGQMARLWAVMALGSWHTLRELEQATGDPAASVSAQLRHLRKERFGAHTIERRHRGDRAAGLWEYRLVVNP